MAAVLAAVEPLVARQERTPRAGGSCTSVLYLRRQHGCRVTGPSGRAPDLPIVAKRPGAAQPWNVGYLAYRAAMNYAPKRAARSVSRSRWAAPRSLTSAS